MTTSQEISTLTYDQRFEAALGISVCGIVLAALWIVHILIKIEANKASFFAGPDHSLEMQEEGGDGAGLPRPTSPTMTKSRKTRRVRLSYKLMQLGSVSVLLLLTYLLLVVSQAPLWASALGSISVFGVFLKYQIGDELRRQRLDRIVLMMSLFLFIASLMCVCTYSFKSLGNGEIYEGPARIVGYDQSSYNNTDHDPSTRTDLEVQWGKSWGCPLSGGKVCQAVVQGAMCTVNLEPANEDGTRRHRRRRRNRQRDLAYSLVATQEEANVETSNATSSTSAGEEENNDLEAENAELEKENEELQKEVEGMCRNSVGWDVQFVERLSLTSIIVSLELYLPLYQNLNLQTKKQKKWLKKRWKKSKKKRKKMKPLTMKTLRYLTKKYWRLNKSIQTHMSK